MITRVSAVLAGLVLAGTVYAAEKPAVQVRQRMEGGIVPAVFVERSGYSVTSRATKPAVAAMQKHQVREVGYTKQGAKFEGSQAASSVKPAVEARQAMEQ